MFGNPRTPAAAYKQVSLESTVSEADPHRLILMLFEGASLACTQARIAMQEGRIADKGAAFSKAINIIDNGLLASLNPDQGGALATQLASLYEYISSRLLWANMKNDLSALDEAQHLLDEIFDAWRQIGPQATHSAPVAGE